MIDYGATPGSNRITWEASGSVTTTGFTNALGNDLNFRIPKENGNWELLDLTGTGDLLTQQTLFNNTGAGILSYLIGGGSSIVFDLAGRNVRHDLNAILPVSQNVTYPVLNGNTVLSLSGNGWFDLNGATFENVFNAGSYSRAINGGQFITTVSVPEASAAGLSGVCLLAILLHRQRSLPFPRRSQPEERKQ